MKYLYFFLLFFFLINISICQNNKEGQEMVNTCTNALMQSIPPMWCWKHVKDKSMSPRHCPSGYSRTNNACLKNCNIGYSMIGGVCYKGGDKKNKDKYVPDKISNSDSRVKCPINTYKDGAKCYADCNVIGMENCGKAACSLDRSACVNTIIEMVRDVIQGIIEFVSFCVSLGSSSGVKAAKTGLNKGLKLVSNKGIETALKGIKKAFASKFKETIKSKAKQAAKNLFNTFKKYSQNEVNKICEEVYKKVENKVAGRRIPSKEELLKAIDVFDISNIVTSCKSKDAYECTRACLNTAKDFDPTGLLTIATTFMKPRCVVPEAVFSDFIYFDEFYMNVNGCIRVYYENDFLGDFTDICGDASLLKNINSVRANSLNSYLLFTEHNHQGKKYLLGKLGGIENLDSYIENGDKIKSVKKLSDYCVYIFKDGKLNEICEDVENIDLNEVIIEIYSDNVILTVYSEEKYKGQSVRLTQMASGSKLNGIKSIKINAKYESLGFLCGHEANTKEIIRLNDEGDVECLSIDGVNCVILPESLSQCVEYVNLHSDDLSPISCNKDIPRLIDLDSYSVPNWCINGHSYFTKSLEYIQ